MSRDWTADELQAASAAMKAMGHMEYEEFCESLKEVRRMELRVNLNGKNRKDLVATIAELTGEQAVYMKVPTCAYKIGAFTIGKFGSLTIEDGDTDSKAELVIERLSEMGYEISGFQKEEPVPEQKATETPQQPQEAQASEPEQQDDKLTVEIPANTMDERALSNLDRIIDAKGNLLRKALGTDNLSYKVDEERIRFPWFTLTGEDGEAEAYMQLISALVDMARNSKRITAKEKDVENEKYTFRCFLLRLGFIGQEYKTTRKLLMKNLEGNAAWKDK